MAVELLYSESRIMVCCLGLRPCERAGHRCSKNMQHWRERSPQGMPTCAWQTFLLTCNRLSNCKLRHRHSHGWMQNDYRLSHVQLSLLGTHQVAEEFCVRVLTCACSPVEIPTLPSAAFAGPAAQGGSDHGSA